MLTRGCLLWMSAWALGAMTLLRLHPVQATEPQVKPPQFLLAWGKKGTKEGELLSPIGIAVNRADEFFVTEMNDRARHFRVQKFTADGKFLSGFKLPGSAPGIAVDAKGRLYICFMSQHKVGVFTEDGKLVREWGQKGNGDGEFNTPGGLALGADGTVFVADQVNRRVQKFTPEGKFLGKWGEHGKKPGQFDGIEEATSRYGGPHFLAIDGKGHVYTTEAALGRVQQFNADGEQLGAWGDKGDQLGGFSGRPFFGPNTFGPMGICTDKQDRVWVGAMNNRVQLYTAEGKYLTGISGTGSEPGQFVVPHAMLVDSRGYLYVVDSGNHRIQKFEVPAAAPERSRGP